MQIAQQIRIQCQHALSDGARQPPASQAHVADGISQVWVNFVCKCTTGSSCYIIISQLCRLWEAPVETTGSSLQGCHTEEFPASHPLLGCANKYFPTCDSV